MFSHWPSPSASFSGLAGQGSASWHKLSSSISLNSSFGHESQPSGVPSVSQSAPSSNPGHMSSGSQMPSPSASLSGSAGHVSMPLHTPSLSSSTLGKPSHKSSLSQTSSWSSSSQPCPQTSPSSIWLSQSLSAPSHTSWAAGFMLTLLSLQSSSFA